jgi:hypothetical protein
MPTLKFQKIRAQPIAVGYNLQWFDSESARAMPLLFAGLFSRSETGG